MAQHDSVVDEPVNECAGGCEGFVSGQKYVLINEKPYCLNCLKKMDVEKLLELLGYEVDVATYPDWLYSPDDNDDE
jgi:hypothetical protein